MPLPPSPRKLLEQTGLVQDAPLSETPQRNRWRWVLLGVALVSVLAILSGKNPDQLALPGLFTLGFSVVIGLTMGEFGQVLKIGRPRFIWPFVMLLTLGGLVGVTWQWYGRYLTRTVAAYREHPLHDDPLAGAFPTELPPDAKPEAREILESIQRSAAERSEWKQERAIGITFPGYLQNRLAGFPQLKGLRAPWPIVIWVSELLVCSLLAGWIARRNSKLPDESAAGTPEVPKLPADA